MTPSVSEDAGKSKAFAMDTIWSMLTELVPWDMRLSVAADIPVDSANPRRVARLAAMCIRMLRPTIALCVRSCFDVVVMLQQYTDI